MIFYKAWFLWAVAANVALAAVKIPCVTLRAERPLSVVGELKLRLALFAVGVVNMLDFGHKEFIQDDCSPFGP